MKSQKGKKTSSKLNFYFSRIPFTAFHMLETVVSGRWWSKDWKLQETIRQRSSYPTNWQLARKIKNNNKKCQIHKYLLKTRIMSTNIWQILNRHIMYTFYKIRIKLIGYHKIRLKEDERERDVSDNVVCNGIYRIQ